MFNGSYRMTLTVAVALGAMSASAQAQTKPFTTTIENPTSTYTQTQQEQTIYFTGYVTRTAGSTALPSYVTITVKTPPNSTTEYSGSSFTLLPDPNDPSKWSYTVPIKVKASTNNTTAGYSVNLYNKLDVPIADTVTGSYKVAY